MTHNRVFSHCLICAFILVVGLGLAFVAPLLASSQSLAAQSEVGEQVNAPEATRYYVAKTGNGSDGLSWAKAFTKLQDALSAASSGDQIWVAKGVYTPGTNEIDFFDLVPGVALYGGFDTGDVVLTDRDWETNLTVLSGDIGGDDFTDGNGVVSDTGNINGDNAYHVVAAAFVTGSTELDGFTITAGQADGINFPSTNGGGFFCYGLGGGMCSPSLRNVNFSGNLASVGGAMYNDARDFGYSSPILINVTFSGNSADNHGGAMYNYGYNDGISSPILINVTFSGNSADYGGAMYNYGNNGVSNPSLRNVNFSGNSADFDGGAMYNDGSASGTSSPSLSNVTFSGNSAGHDGGAMFNYGVDGTSEPEVRNSILWNNKDNSGTGTITANIFNVSNNIKLTQSLVEDSGGSGSNWIGGSYVDGGGNIDSDPMFVTPINPSTAPSTTGNLRLQTGSPAIDAGENAYVSVSFDLDNKARVVDGNLDGTPVVDMGAYETQIYYYLPLIFR